MREGERVEAGLQIIDHPLFFFSPFAFFFRCEDAKKTENKKKESPSSLYSPQEVRGEKGEVRYAHQKRYDAI